MDKCILCGSFSDVKVADIDNAPVCFDCMSWGATREEIEVAMKQQSFGR